MDHIKVQEGDLNSYEVAENTTDRGRYVNKLEFIGTTISGPALHSLSYKFPVLDLLDFRACKSEKDISGSTTLNLDMSNTSVNTLSIYAPRKAGVVMVMMSVHCMDQGLSKYLLTAISDDRLEEIDEKKFEGFKGACVSFI